MQFFLIHSRIVFKLFIIFSVTDDAKLLFISDGQNTEAAFSPVAIAAHVSVARDFAHAQGYECPQRGYRVPVERATVQTSGLPHLFRPPAQTFRRFPDTPLCASGAYRRMIY